MLCIEATIYSRVLTICTAVGLGSFSFLLQVTFHIFQRFTGMTAPAQVAEGFKQKAGVDFLSLYWVFCVCVSKLSCNT